MMSVTDIKYISYATEEAMKSQVLMRHGAIAVTNGKIMGRGFNNYRTYSRDKFINNTCTCHAEVASLRNMYYGCANTYGKAGINIKGVYQQ
jgi:tRNA(Arg) A34 adenosine deaminase TadA